MKNSSRSERLGLHSTLGIIICSVMISLCFLSIVRSSPGEAGGLGYEAYFPAILHRPSIGDIEHLLIIEVLYDPDPEEGGVEWFEIFNPTGETIDLSSYKIGDEETLGGSEGMLRFPDGSTLGPLRIAIVAADGQMFEAAYGFKPAFEMQDSGSSVPELSKYGPWAGGNINLSNTGDELILMDKYDKPVDAVSWGNSVWAFDPPAFDAPRGSSLERTPGYADMDAAQDWVIQPIPAPGGLDLTAPTPTPTPGPTPTPLLAGFLISEVYYDSIGPEPAGEWMELYNHGPDHLNLDVFKVGDAEERGDSEGMYQFPPGSQLAPGDVVVVSRDAAAFFAEFGFYPDYELNDTHPEVPEMVKYSAWSGGGVSLSNSGDEVVLLGSLDQIIDSVSWGGSSWAFDPSVSGVSAGHSIERAPPDLDSDSAVDWRDQESPDPGTVPASTAAPSPGPSQTPEPSPTLIP